MSEFRRNPITGHWVIVAENRAQRPREIVLEAVVREQDCPFCEGQEMRTPNEVLSRRQAGTHRDAPGWRVRVVPNKFPAVEATDENSPGAGVHEVVVESPRHLTSILQLEPVHVAEVLDVYRERLSVLRPQWPGSSSLIFKNSGAAAGATLAHLHSQLVVCRGQDFGGDDRLERFRLHFEEFGACPACRMADEAQADGRVVAQSEHFLAICPFASRFAYETWILPLRHKSHFDELEPASLPELAGLFRTVLSKLERAIGSSAYNYLIQTAPFDMPGSEHYHWHIEILPRVTTIAGFELGTGYYINPLSPQRAASALAKL